MATDTAVSDAAPQNVSSSKPINSSRLNRFLVLAGVKLLRRFRKSWGQVIFLTPKVCVKISTYANLSEASTMQFIREHTSIPAPKVYCAFRHAGKTYIVMENIPGTAAVMRWGHLSEQSRDKVLGQLQTMVDEMRRIAKPDGKICNADGGSLWDCRLPTCLDRYGPFSDTQEFHSFLRNEVEKAPPGYPDIQEMIDLHKRDWGQPVFTHGDLSSLNILLRGDDVVGIVDWETAGWYPPYWEYTTASQVNIRNLWWADYIGKFLEPWPEAMKMETIRKTWWGI